jgi:hypothetical protein
MLRNKNSDLIVAPENAGINGFVRLSATFAILISGLSAFCKTNFCFQGAILEVSFAKKGIARS